ncbi:MAG: SCO family protein [Proteobacteria bacterium]|nr:SCO family protein [Pseudomonadota bacterium]
MMRRFVILIFLFALAACGRGEMRPGATDITGVMPDLKFVMQRANDGAWVTQDSYRGKIALLYFGYTHCPDVCPATLSNLADVLKDLGARAGDVRVLFVSVDPARDDLAALKEYANAFAPQIDGLRGSDNEIAKLAQRYRVLYSVTKTDKGVEVMHSGSVFIFDRDGKAREVMTDTSHLKAISADISSLLTSK